jgi:hypothetical protein
VPMPSPRKPRIRARLAGPSGLAAALALGAAGPASASVHRAAVSGPASGWIPTAAATATDSPLGALAVLGACGAAGFLLLVLGRRRDVDEPADPTAEAAPDLEAMMRTSQPGQTPTTMGPDSVAAPIWVKRLNDQAPPPSEPSRAMDSAYRG